MKTQNYFRRLVFLAAAFLPAASASANPIEMPEKPLTPEITFLMVCAIMLEVVCILLMLWRSKKPRFFILWLVGIHLFTYPAFLGFLWLEQNMRPAFAIGIGEGLVVVVEGTLIYLICRFAPSAKSDLASPSIIRCLLASLIGNILSASAFPILLAIYDRIASI
jgi:hypothetical protein